MKNKVIAFDLDQTLCEEMRTFERALAKPIQENINICNDLYENNTIVIFTARSWQEYKLTEKWLQDHNVKYHHIVCGKYPFDLLIDDKAISVRDIRVLKTNLD